MNNEYKGLLFPNTPLDLDLFFDAKDKQDYLVISNSLTITIYCLENEVDFKEEYSIIDFLAFRQVSVKTLFSDWLNSLETNLNDSQRQYLNTFEYSVTNLLKAKEYTRLLVKELLNKYSFEEVFLFDYSEPASFSRENTDAYKKWIMTIHLEDAGIRCLFTKEKTFKIRFRHLIFSLASRLPRVVLYLEIWLRWLISRPQLGAIIRLVGRKFKSPQLLFFSSGRDAVFHDILVKESGFQSLVVRGSSKHDKNVKGGSEVTFDMDIKTFLAAGSLKPGNRQKNFLSRTKLWELLVPDSTLSLKKTFSGKVFMNYLMYQYLREVNLIRIYEGGINLLSPSAVFCTSLYLPVLAAKNLKIPTVTQAEGVGIDFNPMAPCPGNMIFSPSKSFNDQVLNYSRETGELSLVGPYYYE